jgi:hypothetical protein
MHATAYTPEFLNTGIPYILPFRRNTYRKGPKVLSPEVRLEKRFFLSRLILVMVGCDPKWHNPMRNNVS